MSAPSSKRTKIVCTIGPASNTEPVLMRLVEAGMNVARLNFSHGTHEEHAAMIKTLRSVAEKTGEPITILQDLQGPKIRVGELPKEGIKLENGKDIVFSSASSEGSDVIPVTYPNLHKDTHVGERLLLDDGLLSVTVKEIDGERVICTVEHGGVLTSHKGLNLPDTKTSIPVITDKDLDDLKFGISQGIDWVALSFVRSADDIRLLRQHIEQESKEDIKIIAKIEKPEAVDHIDEIVAMVDGIMVARGDLGIELAAEKVPVIQKSIVKKCLEAGKPVVIATQMLDSMIRNPRPTRAEVSDIANAVIDHADATMLSGETASGAYPVEAVTVMASTIAVTEKSEYDDLPLADRLGRSDLESASNVASAFVKAGKVSAVLVVSHSDHAAQTVSRFRPEAPIFVASTSDRSARQLNIIWGIRPILVEPDESLSTLTDRAIEKLKKEKLIQDGEQILIIAGEPVGKKGAMDLVEIRKV